MNRGFRGGQRAYQGFNGFKSYTRPSAASFNFATMN